jgi:hypothetical protein
MAVEICRLAMYPADPSPISTASIDSSGAWAGIASFTFRDSY